MKLTKAKADELLLKIKNYIKTKEHNIYDAFYLVDLDIFIKLINEATVKEQEEVKFTDCQCTGNPNIKELLIPVKDSNGYQFTHYCYSCCQLVNRKH